MQNIYMDHAATTKIDGEVLLAMMPYLTEYYGNPSSDHMMGYIAKEAIENARQQCAKAINAEPEEIIFTSGGSEANNLVICNYYNVLTTNIEHHSVLNSAKRCRFYHMTPVDKDGRVDLNDYTKCLDIGSPILVSVGMVNNEIGTIQDIKKLAELAHHGSPTYFHTDAVQAFGHIPIDVKDLGVDYLSVSGHKFGAQKGTGFLYAKKNFPKLNLSSLIDGGGQEYGIRAGTENVAGIVGLGCACELAVKNMDKNTRYVGNLRDELLNELLKIDGVYINGDSVNRVESNINIRIDDINASQLIEYANTKGIFFSSGSACNSNSGEPSHVLKAIGLSDEQADSSIRLTLGADNTEDDIKNVLGVIRNFIGIMRD